MKKTTEMGMLVVPNLRILTFTVPVNREQDLPEASGAMPSRRVISDGRKHIAPPHACNALHAVKKRLERLLSKHLVRFLGGFFGPDLGVQEALAGVPELEMAWNDAMDELCRNLPALYAEQEAEAGPQWVDMLRRARLSEDEVRARCRFNVAPVAIAKVHDAGVGDMADAAYVAVLQDLSTDATRMVRQSFEGKTEVLATAVAPLRTLVSKLRSFSFADPRLAPIADAFDTQLTSVPTAGRLNRAQTAIALQVLGLLGDPERLIAYGEQACQVFTPVADLFARAKPAQQDTVAIEPAKPALPAPPRPIPVALPLPATQAPVRRASMF